MCSRACAAWCVCSWTNRMPAGEPAYAPFELI
jgi:hypothetical protein